MEVVIMVKKIDKSLVTVGDVMKAKAEVKPVGTARDEFLQRFYNATAKFITFYTTKYNDANKGNDKKKPIVGVHCGFSGYLSTMANHFHISQTEVIELVKELVEQKAIEQRPARKGYTIYLFGTMPKSAGISLDGLELE
jgi:hypothetical protein